MSTTLIYELSKRFSGKECCIIQITVSAGSKVLPIRTISKEPDEEEILLDRDGIMVVTGNTIRNDMMKVIFATYCPSGSKPVRSDEEIKKADQTFDSKLIVEKLIESLQDEDPDFVDEDTIKISYSRVTGGKNISEQDLGVIKRRLGIN